MTTDTEGSESVLVDVEDRLFPILDLDVWERCLYYHLLRHSRIVGREGVSFALLPVARATGMSETKVRESVRSLDAKGAVRIDDRTKRGHFVRVFLPDEIERVRARPSEDVSVDLDTLDFYADRRLLPAILRREAFACFYCGRTISVDDAARDHVIPEVDGGNGSHRNIVGACHECNSLKQSTPADDFLRQLYRRGVLNQEDLAARLGRLTELKAGQLTITVD